MKNKGFKILFAINVLLAFIDGITTYIYPHKELLETNPLFLTTGSWYLIEIFNIIFFVTTYIWYKKSDKEWFKYLLINQLMLLLFMRIMAIYNAITNLTLNLTKEQVVTYLVQNPGVVVQAAQTNIKIQLISFLCGFVAFLIWQYDNYKKKYYKRIEISIINKE